MHTVPAVTEFLNADLDLRSASGALELFNKLANELNGQLLALHINENSAGFEVEFQPETIDAAIRGFEHALSGIDVSSGSPWARLDLRSLNVGIRAAAQVQAHLSVSPESLAWISKMNLQLAFTIYGY